MGKPKKNVGTLDRVARIIVAVVVAVLYFKGVIEGPVAASFGIVSGVFILTSLVSFCPLYRIAGVSTCQAYKTGTSDSDAS
ncbi:MAG: DUF2892 domain-containing protein [Alphaproteobacteria bacterium]|nr:DUF2892 domain-containing protein [Alphaproteobacteria bacterium]